MKVTVEINLRSSIRWLLALVLIWAGVSKLADLQAFYASVASYQLPLPDMALRFASIVLPWLELLCGVFLLTGNARRAAGFWAVVLFALFVVATGQAWVRGLDISCGCLNLSMLGFDGSSSPRAAQFLESMPFAFCRALLLLAGALYSFRECAGRGLPPVAQVATPEIAQSS